MTTEVVDQPMTAVDKFELLIKDFSSHMETAKCLSARLKVLQKEVNKSSRGKRKKSPVPEDPDAPKKVSALQKPVAISDELCKFLGFEVGSEHSRQEVTSSINSYIKEHNLQDPSNRRFILLDGSDKALALKTLLRDPDQPVTFFNIQRYLKPHYPPSAKDAKDAKEAKTTIVADPSVPEPVVVSTPPPVVRQDADVVPDAAVVTEAEAPPPPPKAPAKKRVVRNPK